MFRLRPLALVALALPLVLAGCGRRGPLELPNGAPTAQSPAAEEARQARVLNDNGEPGLVRNPNQYVEVTPPKEPNVMTTASSPPPPRAINEPPVKNPRPFVLDPLL